MLLENCYFSSKIKYNMFDELSDMENYNMELRKNGGRTLLDRLLCMEREDFTDRNLVIRI